LRSCASSAALRNGITWGEAAGADVEIGVSVNVRLHRVRYRSADVAAAGKHRGHGSSEEAHRKLIQGQVVGTAPTRRFIPGGSLTLIAPLRAASRRHSSHSLGTTPTISPKRIANIDPDERDRLGWRFAVLAQM
jgi:hypothetical protein